MIYLLDIIVHLHVWKLLQRICSVFFEKQVHCSPSAVISGSPRAYVSGISVKASANIVAAVLDRYFRIEQVFELRLASRLKPVLQPEKCFFCYLSKPYGILT